MESIILIGLSTLSKVSTRRLEKERSIIKYETRRKIIYRVINR